MIYIFGVILEGDNPTLYLNKCSNKIPDGTLQQNKTRQSLNAPAICNCDLDLGQIKLKCQFVRDIVIINICVKFYQNQFTNQGSRTMTNFS